MRKSKIFVLSVVILLLAMLVCGCSTKQESETVEVKKIPVLVEPVKKDVLVKMINLGGLLEPQEEVLLSSKNPTFRVLHNMVNVGDEVSAGTPLIVFDSRDLDLQLEQMRLDYERNSQLFEAGAVSKTQLEQLEYALKNLELQKENLIITSPIDGIVAKADAVEGQLAGSTPLVSIVNIDKLKLQVQVGEANISKLKIGEEMEVEVPAINRKYTGVIFAVAPQIDSMTKAYPVSLELINEERLIKGGMYGEMKLVVEKKEDVITVPQSAILDNAQEKVVYIIENDLAIMREVKLGLTLGNKAEIIEGLNIGDMIVVEGQYAVTDGSEVSAVLRGDNQ